MEKRKLDGIRRFCILLCVICAPSFGRDPLKFIRAFSSVAFEGTLIHSINTSIKNGTDHVRAIRSQYSLPDLEVCCVHLAVARQEIVGKMHRLKRFTYLNNKFSSSVNIEFVAQWTRVSDV